MGKFRCGNCNKFYIYADIDFPTSEWFDQLLQKGWSSVFKNKYEGYLICPKCTEEKKEVGKK